jgi:hypothetical protein
MATGQTIASTSPVFKLPCEVLNTIFKDVTEEFDIPLPGRASMIRACSQVCKIWRETALGSPQLWASTIQYRGDRGLWLGELLERSKPLCLDVGEGRSGGIGMMLIDWLPGVEEEAQPLVVLLKHRNRFSSVDLWMRKDVLWPVLRSQFLERPAPQLRSLKICCIEDIASDPVRALFAGHAPLLRHVHLYNIRITYEVLASMPYLEGLGMLTIYTHRDPDQLLSKWLRCLGEMTSLKWLSLECTLPTPDLDQSPAIGQTPLISLEVLSLAERDISRCLKFLERVEISDKCGLFVGRTDITGAVEPLTEEVSTQLLMLMKSRIDKWDLTKNSEKRFLRAELLRGNVSITNLDLPASQKYLSKTIISEKLFRKGLDPVDPGFFLEFPELEPYSDNSVFNMFFSSLEEALNVTTELDLSLELWFEDDVIEAPHPGLATKFAQMSSIQTLRTEMDQCSDLFLVLKYYSRY